MAPTPMTNKIELKVVGDALSVSAIRDGELYERSLVLTDSNPERMRAMIDAAVRFAICSLPTPWPKVATVTEYNQRTADGEVVEFCPA